MKKAIVLESFYEGIENGDIIDVVSEHNDRSYTIYKMGFCGHDGDGQEICKDKECWFVSKNKLKLIEVGTRLVWDADGDVEEVLAVHDEGILTKRVVGFPSGSINGWTYEDVIDNFILKPEEETKECEEKEEVYYWFHLSDDIYLTVEYVDRFRFVQPLTINDLSEEELRDLEIRYNYYRYREQFDNVELDWHDADERKYVINYDNDTNVYDVDFEWQYQTLNGLYFSTEEHAVEFIKLIKESA